MSFSTSKYFTKMLENIFCGCKCTLSKVFFLRRGCGVRFFRRGCGNLADHREETNSKILNILSPLMIPFVRLLYLKPIHLHCLVIPR